MNFTPFRGLIGDIKRRTTMWMTTSGFHPKVVASILFSFLRLANAVAFGVLTEKVTGGQIGTIEMILATAVGGVIFAVFSGQPLTILGVRDPSLFSRVCSTPSVKQTSSRSSPMHGLGCGLHCS